jgi:hypothetical protein
MPYVLIEDNVVIQKQVDPAEGFIEVDDSVVCGQILQDDGSFINPPPSPEIVMMQYQMAVQNHLDEAARRAGYDSIASAASYADEPAVPKFQAEGQAFRAWRSLCWAYCYQALDEVQNGERQQPTVDELIDELPTLVLPE